jgi:hypothetical protein
MLKLLALALILASCGDNIIPPPDAARWSPEEPPLEPMSPDGPPDAPPLEPPTDAGVDAPTCADKHAGLNGHQHKCQHVRGRRGN